MARYFRKVVVDESLERQLLAESATREVRQLPGMADAAHRGTARLRLVVDVVDVQISADQVDTVLRVLRNAGTIVEEGGETLSIMAPRSLIANPVLSTARVEREGASPKLYIRSVALQGLIKLQSARKRNAQLLSQLKVTLAGEQ